MKPGWLITGPGSASSNHIHYQSSHPQPPEEGEAFRRCYQTQAHRKAAGGTPFHLWERGGFVPVKSHLHVLCSALTSWSVSSGNYMVIVNEKEKVLERERARVVGGWRGKKFINKWINKIPYYPKLTLYHLSMWAWKYILHNNDNNNNSLFLF